MSRWKSTRVVVGALSRFEEFVETVLEGSFARLMRTQLQPIEIAKRLGRAMDDEQRVGAGKVIVANHYLISLNPEDFRHYEQGLSSWRKELAEYLVNLANERRLSLFGPPLVEIEADGNIPLRHVCVTSRWIDTPAEVTALKDQADVGNTLRFDSAAIREALAALPDGVRLVADVAPLAGTRCDIDKPLVLIGRALDNDLVLELQGVSRYHAQIVFRAGHFFVRDLKSTNGTFVNGETVSECLLHDGDHVTFAGAHLVFRIGR